MDTARQLSIAETEPNGSVADPQLFGNLTKARAVGAQHPYLVSVHDTARTPKLLARGPRIPNARTDALADQIALKLGNGRDHTRTDE